MASPDLLSPECAADPTETWRMFREEHPLYFDQGMKSYVLSRYADVERAFKDKVFTSDNYSWQLEPVHGRTILQMDGRDHSVHRGRSAAAS
jgi:cytochrome P450